MEHYEKERLRNNNAIYEEQKRTREAGERKLRLYLDTKEALTEREYMQIALENNLIKEEELSQNISREAAKAVLEKLSNLYYTESFEPRRGHVFIDA